VIDLQPHDIEVHVIVSPNGAPGGGSYYRARFKDEPEIEGTGLTERSAIDGLYEARKQRQQKAARPAEAPVSGFMRHATELIGSVTRMGWEVGGSPAISPGPDGGGEVTLTLRLAHRRTVVVFAVDERI
jgi:hypothetical protein